MGIVARPFIYLAANEPAFVTVPFASGILIGGWIAFPCFWLLCLCALEFPPVFQPFETFILLSCVIYSGIYIIGFFGIILFNLFFVKQVFFFSG